MLCSHHAPQPALNCPRPRRDGVNDGSPHHVSLGVRFAQTRGTCSAERTAFPGAGRAALPVPETDLAESENELQNVSPILQNQICGKTTTTPGFGELIDRECSPKPGLVVVLPHIWFWRIGLTFWSSFSDSARSFSGSGTVDASTSWRCR